jgi:transcriptional regulator with XRE-family HTH domain
MTAVDAHERRRSFCARLKNERERRGTSLGDIASTTKVKASLLEALERGDVARWPKGLYRRAYFRDYVTAIGLSPDPLVAEFLDLFSEGEERPVTITSRPATPPVQPPLRLTFGGTESSAVIGLGAVRRPGWLAVRQQALAAAIDLSFVVATATLASFALSASAWTAAAIVAGAYYSMGTLMFGQTPAARWLGGRPWKALPPPPTPLAPDVAAANVLDLAPRPSTGAIARNGIGAIG